MWMAFGLGFFNGGTLEEITTKLTILHLLRKSNVYVHNTASSIEKTVDKVRTSGLLSINELNHLKQMHIF